MGQHRSKPYSATAVSSEDATVDSVPPLHLAVMPSTPSSNVVKDKAANKALVISNTMPLEHYIRKAMPDKVRKGLPEHLFRPSRMFEPPMLKRGMTSRVLIFSGSFNPPHIGHKLLLSHAFFRSQFPNIIAAIIVLVSEKDIRGKRWLEPKLLLNHKERTRLWHDNMLNPWSWIAPSYRAKVAILKNLGKVAAKDGFNIEFVHVAGPDYVIQADGCQWWDVTDSVFIGNYFRPGHFDVVGMSLEPVRGCSPWIKSNYPEQSLLARVTAGKLSAVAVLYLLYENELMKIMKKKDLPSEEAETEAEACLERCLKQRESSWICHNKLNPQQMMQFMLIHEFQKKVGRVEVSSTAVRKILQERLKASRNGVIAALRGVVLNLETLIEIVEAKEKKAMGRLLGKQLYALEHRRLEAQTTNTQRKLRKKVLQKGRKGKRSVETQVYSQ